MTRFLIAVLALITPFVQEGIFPVGTNDRARIEAAFGGPVVIEFGQKLMFGESKGIFISLPIGTQVKALLGGKVVESGFKGEYSGLGAEIKVDRDITLIYGCLGKLAVSNGDSITPGQVIGYSAGGGDVCGQQGPGVKIRLKRKGMYINPIGNLP